eukprot:TRINITY_DN1146_c0_g1_i2.p1 TRINITY_DN1146_c0_g1~~TRINITY_DN1146_c0_g1_i2.p1  ORF type:complete len:299 (-),score=17.84 TRINITY_DN1146_c0_g1_i2:62-958(-)
MEEGNLLRRRIAVHSDIDVVTVELEDESSHKDVSWLKQELAAMAPHLGDATEMRLSVPKEGLSTELEDQWPVSRIFEENNRSEVVNFRSQRYVTLLGLLLTNQPRGKAFAIRAAIIIVGSLFVAACAQMSFFWPWDHVRAVPGTMQTFAVLLIGSLAGKVLGPLAIVLYLLEGLVGLPFFAMQTGGYQQFDGPTTGYFVGFFFASLVTGFLAERGFGRQLFGLRMAIVAMVAGNATIYVFGIPVLAYFIGWSDAFVFGFVQFLPGDALKIVLASVLLPFAWRLMAFIFKYRSRGPRWC